MSALSATSSRAWFLSALLSDIITISARDDRPVTGLALDHRCVKPGSIFFACRGSQFHALKFAAEALASGAQAVLYEPSGAYAILDDVRQVATRMRVPLLPVVDLSARLGRIAARFHDDPSKKAFVIGVTGTNGKTTCSQFLAQAFGKVQPCAVIGTLGYGFFGDLQATTRTTPDAVSLQSIMARLVAKGARRIVMEVSSHALEQGRINDVAFDVALFTNLSHDHLDYHGEMSAYGAVKQRLFATPGLQSAVINMDDSWSTTLLDTLADGVGVIGYRMVNSSAATFQLGKQAFPVVSGQIIHHGIDGLGLEVRTPWGNGMLQTKHFGRFNASNLLATLATLLASGMPLSDALSQLREVQAIRGRMERIGAPGKPLAVIDYAHTPDALLQVLATLHEVCRGRLWCVFGCGGDRDHRKRAQMGIIAERGADLVIITDDNPRGEDAAAIVDDILAGMVDPGQAIVCHDRASAIRYAMDHACADDVVLIAGKGHEECQLIGESRIVFSDRSCVAEWLAEGRE